MKRTSRSTLLAHEPIAIKGRPISETVAEDREERPSRGAPLRSAGKKRGEKPLRDGKDDLSPKILRELRRRIVDADDPVRYVVFSDVKGKGRWRLWLDVSNDMYGMSIDQATLFKRKHVSQAVARTSRSGRQDSLSVARITTKNGKRRILKIEK